MALICAAKDLSRILNTTTRVRGFEYHISHAASVRKALSSRDDPCSLPSWRFQKKIICRGNPGRQTYKQVIRTWGILIHHLLKQEV